MVKRIISGGQTGADRGGLDASIALGIPHGGYCPLGRKAEDGVIPACYNVEETKQPTYPPRTALNVRYSDGTIIFNLGKEMERGCQLTIELCCQMRKPFCVISGDDPPVKTIQDFLEKHYISTLNIAGNRESKSPGLQKYVKEVIVEALGT